jgi:hypothetical protein
MKLPYIFERYSDTLMVIEVLIPEVRKVIEKYGYATVADVCEIMDWITFTVRPTMCQFIHYRQGWTSINEFFVNPYSERRWGYTEYGIEVSNLKYL